jgi:hypothetical protein
MREFCVEISTSSSCVEVMHDNKLVVFPPIRAAVGCATLVRLPNGAASPPHAPPWNQRLRELPGVGWRMYFRYLYGVGPFLRPHERDTNLQRADLVPAHVVLARDTVRAVERIERPVSGESCLKCTVPDTRVRWARWDRCSENGIDLMFVALCTLGRSTSHEG